MGDRCWFMYGIKNKSKLGIFGSQTVPSVRRMGGQNIHPSASRTKVGRCVSVCIGRYEEYVRRYWTTRTSQSSLLTPHGTPSPSPSFSHLFTQVSPGQHNPDIRYEDTHTVTRITERKLCCDCSKLACLVLIANKGGFRSILYVQRTDCTVHVHICTLLQSQLPILSCYVDR